MPCGQTLKMTGGLACELRGELLRCALCFSVSTGGAQLVLLADTDDSVLPPASNAALAKASASAALLLLAPAAVAKCAGSAATPSPAIAFLADSWRALGEGSEDVAVRLATVSSRHPMRRIHDVKSSSWAPSASLAFMAIDQLYLEGDAAASHQDFDT